MAEQVLEISATEFKAKCLRLFKDLEAHRYSKVVITRRGKPIAELAPRDREVPDLFGCMKGSVNIPPGFDLTKPILEDIPEAESGKGPSDTSMVLLDTCAIIWMVEDAPLDGRAKGAIRHAAAHRAVLVSPVSAWEVGLLGSRVSAGFTFRPSPVLWFRTLLARPGIYLTPLTPRSCHSRLRPYPASFIVTPRTVS